MSFRQLPISAKPAATPAPDRKTKRRTAKPASNNQNCG